MATTRDNLIRRHFEAMRDLTWAETLEPKFREQGVDPAAMKEYREAWNRHSETRDWAWWQHESKGDSTERLEDMLMDCIEKLDAIGMLQWQKDKGQSEQEKFQKILDGAGKKEEKSQEHSKPRDTGREL
jgi:hypothetical protein